MELKLKYSNQETPSKGTPSKGTPSKDTPSKDTPSKKISFEDTPLKDTISEDTPLKKRKISKCSGCFPDYQPNQLAHTGPGGCLEDLDVIY